MELEIMKNKKSDGFTIVEMLVAVAIFGMLVLSITNVALAIIKSQRKSFAIQNVQETSRYILETASKEIRTSKVNSFTDSTLDITNAQGQAVIYSFDSNALKRNGQIISPSGLNLTGVFYVRQYVFPERSLVTIFMKLISKEAKEDERAGIYLQSTVSPRP